MESVSLIYKFLVLSIMIEEMNPMLDGLGLPPTELTRPKQLIEWEVSFPRTYRTGHSAFQSIAASTDVVDAYIRTDRIHFVGYTRGFGIIRLNKNGFEDWPDSSSREGVPTTNVSTRLAYDLARGWMEAAGVDISALEARHPVDIRQDKCHAEGRRLASPNFHVRWGYYPEKAKGQYKAPVAE